MAMTGRARLNLALVILVAALAAVSFFRPGGKKLAATVPVITLKAAEVKDIRIQRPGQKLIEMKFGDHGWQLTSPFAMTADSNLLRTLLDTLDAESQASFPAAGADLAKYGLDKPGVELWLNGSHYTFGGMQPVDNQRYVQAGDTIYLMNPLLYYRLDHDAYWWLDKGLIPPGARITAMQLPQTTLTRDKQGMWQLSPADTSVSADDIQRLLDAWQQQLAISVAPLSKDPETGEVSLSIAGTATPLRYAILKDPDFLVLARTDLGLQYELDSSQRDTLLSLVHPKTAPPKH